MLEKVALKTENHGVSKDFQHLLVSAAIELDVLIFNLSLLNCSRFMRHAVLHASVQLRWPHYEIDQS